MKKAEAIKHFGSGNKLAKALGLTRSCISKWPDPVPIHRAVQIENMTHGKVKVRKQMYA
jgi:DNA-binding transcriptional regulator YdaS (Cro superfamily)